MVVRNILFIVRVPVLSEQIVLAPPIVSQASIFLTRLLSKSIFLTEKARDSVTAKGSPSGMATTITVIPRMKKFKISTTSTDVFHSREIPFSMANLINITTTITIAEYSPNFPMSWASFYSFIWRGVGVGSDSTSKLLTFPMHDNSPTTITIILPSPARTLVPLMMIGDGTSCFPALFFYPAWTISYCFYLHLKKMFLCTGSVYPVIALSSVVMSFDSIRYPSEGTSIPSLITTISPTKRSS